MEEDLTFRDVGSDLGFEIDRVTGDDFDDGGFMAAALEEVDLSLA